MLVIRNKFIVAVAIFSILGALLVALSISNQPTDRPVEQNVKSSSSPDSGSDVYKQTVDDQQLLVQFKHAFTELRAARQRAIVEKLGGQLEQTYSHLGNISLVTVNPEASHINEHVSRFRASEWVELVEPNYIVAADSVASTDDKSLTWGLHNTGQSGGQLDADIDAPEAWDKYLAQGDNEKSESIIAVLDSGIEVNHQAFQGKLWSKDNRVGFNACAPENAMNDTHGHGTQVASVIAAVNPHTPIKLLPVKVLCNGSQGNHVSVIAGLDYVLGLKKQGVDIAALNMSWGGEHYSRVLEAVLTKVAANDILLVASAGNQSQNIDRHAHYPASYDIAGLISVAASNNRDHLSATSNYGKHHIDLSAPGENISVATTEGGYTQGSGTSLAAAYVTGTVSLVNSSMPGRSSEQYKAMILSGVDASLPFVDRVATKGRLNANEALGNSYKNIVERSESIPAVISSQTESVSSLETTANTTADKLAGINSEPTLTTAEESAQVPEREPLEVDIVPNHIMMRFTEAYRDLSKDERQALLDTYGVTIVKDYPYAGGSALLEINGAPTAALGKLPAGETKESIYQRVDDIIQQLTESGLVDYAEPDQVVQTTAVPNDPRYNELWGLEKIQAEQAWDYIEQNNANPAEIIVGVIDTGVDYTHPDLAANMWVNPGEIAGDGIDNDGNGYVDDVHGWDARNDDGDPMDDHDHGTHVAGTIGAVRDNSEGIVGVTPYVKIMALKFLGSRAEGGSGSISDAVELMNYIHLMKDQYGVDIRLTNNSWGGGGFSASMEAAISVSNDQNILFVAAAGNDSRNTDTTLYYPQGYELPNVLSVAATDENDALAYFSNFGVESVDIAAPGVGILSTTIGDSYSSFNGTSMATPHVSGAIALSLSHKPNQNIAEMIGRVLDSGDFANALLNRIATPIRLNVNNMLLESLLEVDVTGSTLLVSEGATITFNVRLQSEITESISVTVDKTGDEDISVTPSSLLFTPANWNQWQTVSVSAAQDNDGFDHSALIRLHTTGWLPVTISAKEQDDDDPAAVCDSVTEIPVTECQALVAFYQSTEGDGWFNNQGWFTENPCSWFGIGCENGHVVEVNLLKNNVGGELPVEFFDLDYLRNFYLSVNHIGGAIPSEIANLTSLEILYLDRTQISGEIPPQIGSLSNLRHLELAGNQLTGSIPAEIGNLDQLEALLIQTNQLSGSVPLELGNMENLQLLVLADNNLSGEIPATLGDLSNLTGFQLWGNQFSGEIPASLGNLSNLKSLGLQFNQLTGVIPDALGNLGNLTKIQLYNNQLSGAVPSTFGNLQNLQDLELMDNQLTSLPAELGNLPNLKRIWVVNNQLQGSIPAEWGNASNLSQIILFNNQLSGEIPAELGNLTKLFEFWINDNDLSGSIPSELGNLTNLSHLNLANNRLSGEIPESFGNLTKVAPIVQLPLDLRNNQLSGEIPRSFLNLENATRILLDKNALEANDPDVDAFLNSSRAPFWKYSQTITPKNINISEQNGQLMLSWDLIPFSNGSGSYIVSYSSNINGPFVEHGRTENKLIDEYIIDDGDTNTGRYYSVQSFTEKHGSQKNDITSHYSDSVFLDITPPVVTVSDIVVEATSALTSVDLSGSTAVDDFDGVLTPTPSVTGPFSVGVHAITWSATDSAGNTGTAIQTVTVQDTTVPVIATPPANITFEATGELNPVELGIVSASDLVDGTLTATPSSTGPFGVGEHTITWTVTDSAGNTTTVEQIITVTDTTAPALTAPAAMVVEATAVNTPVTLPEVIAPDSVSGDIAAVADNTGPFTLGAHTITWSATDGAGNVSTATQQLTVQDTTAPEITPPETISKLSVSGESIYQQLSPPAASDIFPFTISNNVTFQSNIPGTFPVGTTTVIWTATDASGNTATAEQQVVVTHVESAELTSPAEGDPIEQNVVYTWTEVSGAQYSLDIGTEKGASNLHQGQIHSSLAEIVADFPDTSTTIYVRLKTHLNNIASYNDYVFNAPAQQYYPNHSSQIACYKADEGFTYAYGDAGDMVVIANPDNDSLSLLNVSRDPNNFGLDIDVTNDFFLYTNSKPSSVTIIDQYLAVTYPESGKLRFSSFNEWRGGVKPWTTWLHSFDRNERPVASVAHDRFLYVALYGTSEVIKYDIGLREIVARLKVDAKPHAMALTSDGSRLLVTRFISGGDYGEVYDINTQDMTFRDSENPSIKLHQVWVPDSLTHGSGVPNYLRSIVIGPNDEYAYVTANKANVERGQYLSGEPLTAENTIRPMIGILDLVNHRDANIDPLTTEGTIDLGEGADPSGITYLPDGVTRVHALQGSNRVEFVNTDTDQKISINTGAGPQSMCATLNTLYVKNHTGRSVSVIDTGTYMNGENAPEVQEVVTVPAADESLTAMQLQGLQSFYSADVLSSGSLFSCASCHDGGSHDGMTWDFTQMGEGLRNTLSLLGANGKRLASFNWSGNADQVQDVEKQLEEVHGFDTSGISGDLDAISVYVENLGKDSIKQSPYVCAWNDSACSSAYYSGANRFIDHCASCHTVGQFSDGQLHDVGTITEASGQRNGEALTGIRTPTLVELWDTAPYFHDGSVETLEETIEVPGHNDFDMTEEQESHLFIFLRNLDRRLYSDDL